MGSDLLASTALSTMAQTLHASRKILGPPANPTAGGPYGSAMIGATAVAWFVWIPVTVAAAGSVPAALHVTGFTTAISGLVLFLLAFAGRPLRQISKSRASRFLFAHRRDLGLCFALTMAVHLVFVVVLPPFLGETGRGSPSTFTLVGGGIAYGFIAAMAATSFVRTRSWLGPRRWHLLHRTGAWVVWIVFFQTVASGIPARPGNAVAATALAGLALLRAGLHLRSRTLG